MLRKGKRAIGYARVSAALQEDGTSLDTQTSAIISLAASMGYEVGPEDVLREVKTGITLARLYAKFRGSNGCDHVGTPPLVAGVGGFFTIHGKR